MNYLIKPFLRLTVFAFIFAMLIPVTTALAAPDCDDPKFENKPVCNPDDPNGEDPIMYTAVLSLGGFVFNPGPSVEVIPNSKENRLRSQTNLDMQRADGDGTTWDLVFAACQLLTPPINSFTVFDDDWSITNFDQPNVAFANIRLPGAKLKLILRGDGMSLDPFLPDPGNTSEFNLSQFSISGRSLAGGPGPSKSCSAGGQAINPLIDNSKLTITAAAP